MNDLGPPNWNDLIRLDRLTADIDPPHPITNGSQCRMRLNASNTKPMCGAQ